MAALVGHQTLYAPFDNSTETVRIQYDFSVDAGATGALDILTAADAIVITSAYAVVRTACTSGGSATLIWGISGGDTDIFMNATQGAVASLTSAAVILPPAVEGTPNVLPIPTALAAAGKLIQTIGTATLTAGVVEYVIEYKKA
jgi:hypothetical protein